jgi:hypothetical protein
MGGGGGGPQVPVQGLVATVRPAFKPSGWITLLVAAALLVIAALVRIGWAAAPPVHHKALQWVISAIALLMFARAIGDSHLVGFFKEVGGRDLRGWIPGCIHRCVRCWGGIVGGGLGLTGSCVGSTGSRAASSQGGCQGTPTTLWERAAREEGPPRHRRINHRSWLLTSAGTSSPAMRLRNNAARASSNVVTGTVIASRIGISQACITGPDLSAEK